MTNKKSLITKISGAILVILFLVFGVAAYETDSLVKDVMILKLDKALRNNPHSLYDYKLKSVSARLWLGDLKINDFELFLKQKALDSLSKNNIQKRQLLEGSINSLLIKGFRIKDFLTEEKVFADKIILNTPRINVFFDQSARKTNKNKFDLDSVFSIIQPNISIHKTELINADLKIFDVDKDSINTFGIDGFSFTLRDLNIDSTTAQTPLRATYSSFNCGSGKSYLYLNEDYDFTMDDFSYFSKDKKLVFSGIKISHVQNKNTYKKLVKDDTPLYNISFDQLTFDLSIGNIFLDSTLKIKQVDLNKLNVSVFQTKKKSNRPDKIKPLLAHSISQIPFALFIGEINLTDCLFSYEFEDKTMKDESVFIKFEHSDINIKNITNEKSYLEDNPNMNIMASSYFMGKGKIDLTANFDLKSTNQSFNVKCNMGGMPFKVMNPVVIPLAPVEFKNGQVHSLELNFSANSEKATGTMDFHYSDVWLSLLKEEEIKSDKKKNKPIFSLLLNNILKKNNIPGTRKYKVGKINTPHDPHKSVLNYLWQATKSGLISSLSRSKRK